MIKLVWLPGHGGIAGSYKADVLTGAGTSFSPVAEWEQVKAPLASGGSLQLDNYTRWSVTKNCAVVRSTWPIVSSPPSRKKPLSMKMVSKMHK